MPDDVTKRPWFVTDTLSCWRWASVQAASLVVAAPELYDWLQTNPQVAGLINEHRFHHLMAFLGLLIIIGRVKNQTKPTTESKP